MWGNDILHAYTHNTHTHTPQCLQDYIAISKTVLAHGFLGIFFVIPSDVYVVSAMQVTIQVS
jgi:hypothetical protein